MALAGGAKGMFYRFFQSKEEVMHALGDQMFLENNPFEAVRERSDLNGLQKIREVLAFDRADGEREEIRHKCRFVTEVLSAIGLPIIGG